jgi:hypothetical protein
MSDDTPAHEPLPAPRRQWYRLALGATVLLVLLVLALLPIAIGSMQDVLGRGPDHLYDLATGKAVTPTAASAAEANATYFNLGVVDLDEETGQITMAVSGNRRCGAACPSLALTFAALDDDADERRGLPPSATITLTPDDRIFSQAVHLPVRGQPSLYPFDQYELWLGVGGVEILPDGTSVEVRPETLAGRAVVTVQNRVPDMIMDSPVPIAPETVRAATDPFGFLTVQALSFARPAYLKVLAVVLVLLVTVSAVLALFMRDIQDLLLGIGGLILGVWGVRSVLMPQSMPTVTAVDLALSWVILLLLLGLALRAALHFYRHSDLPRTPIAWSTRGEPRQSPQQRSLRE